MQVSPRGSESSTDSAAGGQQSSGAATGEASAAAAASGRASARGAFDMPSFGARPSPRKQAAGWPGRSAMVAGGELNPVQKIAHQEVFLGACAAVKSVKPVACLHDSTCTSLVKLMCHLLTDRLL